jgi:gas vesicle protein
MSIFRFLAGVLSGTALGLLFAKQEGKQLRKKMKGKDSKEIAEMLGKELIKAGKDAKDTVEDIAESDEVKKLVKKGKSGVKKAAKKAKTAIKKSPAVKQAVKKVAPKAKKAVKAVKAAEKKVKKAASSATKKVKKAIK